MGEALMDRVHACPSWCVIEKDAPSDHAHVSADVTGGSVEHPLVGRLIRMRQDDSVQVLLNDRVASVDEVGRFLGSLRGLLDKAVPAGPGLGFIGLLAGQAQLTFADMAEAAGLPIAAVEAQAAGDAVLTVAEFEQLALSVARRVADTLPNAG
jgi:hypothetical protein